MNQCSADGCRLFWVALQFRFIVPRPTGELELPSLPNDVVLQLRRKGFKKPTETTR